MLPGQLAELLADCVLARKSMVISGDQGAGKTTLLRALLAAIPDGERIGTLETDYELLTHLLPNRRNMVALQAKVGLGEYRQGRSIGEYTVADLIPGRHAQLVGAYAQVHQLRGADLGQGLAQRPVEVDVRRAVADVPAVEGLRQQVEAHCDGVAGGEGLHAYAVSVGRADDIEDRKSVV